MNLIEFLRIAKIENLGLPAPEVLPQEIAGDLETELDQICSVLNSFD
jgi:hypothetical protein